MAVLHGKKIVVVMPAYNAARTLVQTLEPGMGHLVHLDAYVAGELGGTGVTAAWDVAADVADEIPLMLAGGLSPANVGDAIRAVGPWAVDVSSGVERDGVKDPAAIEAFIKEAKRVDAGDRGSWRLIDRQRAR